MLRILAAYATFFNCKNCKLPQCNLSTQRCLSWDRIVSAIFKWSKTNFSLLQAKTPTSQSPRNITEEGGIPSEISFFPASTILYTIWNAKLNSIFRKDIEFERLERERDACFVLWIGWMLIRVKSILETVTPELQGSSVEVTSIGANLIQLW